MYKISHWNWNSKQGLSEHRALHAAARWQTEGRINELQLLRNLIKVISNLDSPERICTYFNKGCFSLRSNSNFISGLQFCVENGLSMRSCSFLQTIYSYSQDLPLASRQESICQNNDRNTWKTIALL